MTHSALAPDEARSRLHELIVIDVRTPGEYASGHLPGAYNVPLDQVDRALPALTSAARRGDLLVVCRSGGRSAEACRALSEAGLSASVLSGGTGAWTEGGHDLHRPDGARTVWAMERQVRLAAGGLVLLGLAAGLRAPAARWLSAGIAGGLVFSAASDTCGMAVVLARLPHNRPDAQTLADTLDALAR